MKFITKQTFDKYLVQLDGPQDEQLCCSTLAENIYGVEVKETYSGQIIKFENKKRFREFLIWRQIFKQCAPNKKFFFIKYAKQAIKEVAAIWKNDVIEISC